MCVDDKCGECTNNDTMACEDGQARVCEDGQWSAEKKPCPNSDMCVDDKCGECQNGTTICTNRSEQIGYIKTCSNGQWSSENACPDNASCNNTTFNQQCGKCQNGSINMCTKEGDVHVRYASCENGILTGREECKRTCTAEKCE